MQSTSLSKLLILFMVGNFLKSLRDFLIAFRLIDHLYFPLLIQDFVIKMILKTFDVYIQTK